MEHTEILLVIIIFMSLFIILYAMAKMFRIKNYGHKTYQTITGGSMIDNYTDLKYPRVFTLTNMDKKYINIADYYAMDKTDGVHAILIINNTIRMIDNGELKQIADQYCQINDENEITILDTEYINGKYMIFDCPLHKSIDNSRLPFADRLRVVENDENIVKKNAALFQLKTYTEKTWSDIVTYVNTKDINDGSVKIDGVILQPKTEPYWTERVYKVKARTMNTIDFMLKKNGEVYNLYLMGNNSIKYNSLVYEVRASSARDDKLVLFDTPYYNVRTYNPAIKFVQQPGYECFPDIIKDIQSFNINDDLDNHVVEMLFNGVQFYPVRYRDDKSLPNFYTIGMSNMSAIFDPLTADNTYFNNTATAFFDKEIQYAFHTVNQRLREFMFRKLVPGGASVLDLAGGRGGDHKYLIHKNYKNFCCMDSDSNALVIYMNKLQKANSEIKTFKEKLSASALHHSLGIDNSSFISDLKSKHNYPKGGFDLVLMNYAIHYLCGNSENIRSLNDLVKDVLKYSGAFVVTFFDGDKLLQDMKNNEITLGAFTVKHEDGVLTMPLPTIDETGYRKEPIVRKSILNNIRLPKCREYSLVDVCEEAGTILHTIERYNDIIDYLKYIRVRVYKKL